MKRHKPLGFSHPIPMWTCFTRQFPLALQHVEKSCRASVSKISPSFPEVCYSLNFRHDYIINQISNHCQKVIKLHWGQTLKVSIINHNERQPPHASEIINLQYQTIYFRLYQPEETQRLFSSYCTHTTGTCGYSFYEQTQSVVFSPPPVSVKTNPGRLSILWISSGNKLIVLTKFIQEPPVCFFHIF